jgi:hypothetical protein
MSSLEGKPRAAIHEARDSEKRPDCRFRCEAGDGSVRCTSAHALDNVRRRSPRTASSPGSNSPDIAPLD